MGDRDGGDRDAGDGGPLRSTVVALASGAPDGGVAIIRLSGPNAAAIAERLCGSVPPPRSLRRRTIKTGGEPEDGLVVFMPGPKSFTGEDVVELHIHGGVLNCESVLEAVHREGASWAEPGEFTRRAFESGRLSLDQAEGIAATIAAKTRAGLDQARRLSAGELGRTVDGVRETVMAILVSLEAYLDFPEEVPPAEWKAQLEGALERVEAWLAGFEAGRRARQVPRVVLAGPPNAGKSSLLNALLGQRRAIVDAQAGTTRDFVEAQTELGGRRVNLVDTAGLRETHSSVEAAGIGLSRDQIEGADVLLWIEAADAPPSGDRPPSGAVLVENKRDRASVDAGRADWIGCVAAEGDIEAVLEALVARLGDASEGWIGLERHRSHASEAAQALQEAIAGLDGPLEIPAFALQVAERRLGEIRGRYRMGAVGDDVLSAIFSNFCIGK